ncbi:MAG: DUF3786 domain-containing protein [Desulfobacteraceae bacterium]|jgi:hypothetical protein
MDEKVHVFEKTLSTYQERLMAMPWDRLKSSRFFNVSGKNLSMPFFNDIFHVSEKGILCQEGTLTSFDVSVVIYNYLLMFQDDMEEGKTWVAYRDIKDSGPLSVYFADNVENKIAGAFSKKSTTIINACLAMGGYKPSSNLSYDVVMAFDALPSVRLLLLFNREDEDFPASCKVLFSQGVDQYLDPESLAILAAIFASRLCSVYP